MQLCTVKRPLTGPLLTLYSSWVARCYGRTQKQEEVHGEPGRASDSNSPPARVGARDGGYGSRPKPLHHNSGGDGMLATSGRSLMLVVLDEELLMELALWGWLC